MINRRDFVAHWRVAEFFNVWRGHRCGPDTAEADGEKEENSRLADGQAKSDPRIEDLLGPFATSTIFRA